MTLWIRGWEQQGFNPVIARGGTLFFFYLGENVWQNYIVESNEAQ